MLVKLMKTIGHLYCVVLLYLVSLGTEILDSLARKMVSFISAVIGIEETPKKICEPMSRTEPLYEEENFLNEKEMLNKSDFPIHPEELIEKCKRLVRSNFGSKEPELLSSDFQFIFPVVGPLSKDEFIEAFTSFKLEEAFTGSANYFGFSVDPLEPNRVWFFSRAEFTHTGVLIFGAMKMKSTGEPVIGPPQVLSMSFNRSGECYKLTGGYSVDKTVGNTGGLGGVFGFVHAVGGSLPFPEGQPWKPSLRWKAFSFHIPSIVKLWKKEHNKEE